MAAIKTDHLLLRRPETNDNHILEDLWRDERVREFLGGPLLEKDIKKKIIALQEHWDRYGFGLWAVWQDPSQSLIGLCGLHHTDDGVELSYLFFPGYWGQGLAREAAFAALNYGFTMLKHESIISITQESNLRSCRLLETIGMKRIHKFMRYNALQCLYKLNRDEFDAKNLF